MRVPIFFFLFVVFATVLSVLLSSATLKLLKLTASSILLFYYTVKNVSNSMFVILPISKFKIDFFEFDPVTLCLTIYS